MSLAGYFQRLHSGNYTVWTFIKIIYLNLGLTSYNSVVQKISTKFVIAIALWCVILTFWDSGFIENRFTIVLNLGLHFLRFIRAYNIYTEFDLWKFFHIHYWFYLTLYIELGLSLTSLSHGVIFVHYDSCQFYTSIGDASPP